MSERLPIALDAMGGDHAPQSVVEGAELALKKLPELKFLFFGDEATLAALLQKYPKLQSVSEIIHCEDKIADDAKPSLALRQSKNSSMRKAIEAVQEGSAVAAVSGGNTGAMMAIAKLVLKTLPGINRPAAASLLPTRKGNIVALDLGANLECSAEELFQFAIMGDAYARAVLGLEYPRVALLNVGEEDNKGHPEIREAAQMLRECDFDINFCGFVEGTHILQGAVDVVVSDGFTGNVMLKTAEGTARLMGEFIKDAFNSNICTKLSYLMARPALKAMRKKLDPRRYNGAMFLGLNGVVVKSHGGSDEYAVSFAIRSAAELAKHRTNQRIIEELTLSGHATPRQTVEIAEGAK